MAWYDPLWTKRKAITLTGGASGSFVDFQVELTVAYESAMKSDFSDLRFTKSDGTTLLDAWMESYTSSTSATVWVETDTPENTVESDIYMYYGKSDALDYWDIGATFVFGDDAESGAYSDKWVDIAGSGEYSTDEAYKGTHSIKFDATDDQTSVSKNIDVADAVFEAMVKNVGSNNYYTMITGRASQTEQTYYSYRPHESGNAELYKRISGTFTMLDSDASSDDPETWHKWSIQCSGTSIKTYFDDVLRNEATDSDISSGGIGTRGTTSNNQYLDDVRIRKYAANPPTYGFGSEESAPSGLSMAIVMHHLRQMRRS